jgi:hypothetical protein
MKSAFLFAVLAMTLACYAQAATNSMSLVMINSTDYGDTNCMMRIVELERGANTSKLKLTYKKMGSSVGSSMFIMRAFYEVSKARGTEYFINLKEWKDENGDRIYIGGFTNTKDADLKKEFGKEFNYENEYGQKRDFMSVSQLNMLFGLEKKAIGPRSGPYR